MEKLTREEVLHVADLARIEVDDAEIEKYSVELKVLMNDIDKIKEVQNETESLLVTPTDHTVFLRDDGDMRSVDFNEFVENFPKVVGRFVEVPVMLDE